MQTVRQTVESSWRPLQSVVGSVLSDLIIAQETNESLTKPGSSAQRSTKN
jgi:hypothetical protein